MHWWYGDGMGLGFMWFWWALLLATIGVVVWLVVAGRRGGDGRGPGQRGGGEAEQVLKRRYAAGELDTETFGRMLEDIRR